MQVKIPNEDKSPISLKDKSCTSSIYISQPSMPIAVNNDHVNDLGNNMPENVDSSSSGLEQKPVLTIQVNQNNPAMNQSNLVNIVSCFRAYPTITHGGIENLVHSNNTPFSVSVNRNNFNFGGNSKSDESVNNENNQNIVNIEASSKNHAQNVCVQLKPTIKREDLNEISVDKILISESGVTSLTANSNVDYQNMTLDSVANRDQTGLIGAEIEGVIIKTTAGTNVTANLSLNPQQTSESAINQITIAGEVESTDNRVANETCVKIESQTFREQRRRERRERRQARQRAQHHHVTAPVHHRIATGVRSVNVAEPSRTNYEMLPDIINNHFPPPYTTLPLQMPAPPIHSPLTISPVPVVVDDCRFSFPIPIIRRSPSEHSGRKGCCGQFFQSPKSLGLIAMIALGGVTCALGGAAWGASGLAGQPSTHLTVSLLMIGIGVVLVTISGVAWKVTTADSAHCLGMEGTEFEHCGRQQCLRNNSMSHGLLYPEFQHRPPPPTYQASMQEYRLRLLLLDRDRQSHGRRIAAAVAAAQQSSSPPPTYRSNVGSQLRSHRGTLLSHSTARETSGNVFGDLTGIINSTPMSASTPHHACNNRLSGVGVPSSNQGNYHSNNSPIQLSSSLSAVHTSMQPFSSTNTNQISQQCQPKSRLLINHKNSDDVFGNIVSGVINLHQTKEIQEAPGSGQPNHVTSNDANINQFENLCQNNHESGMITIVTINNNQNIENGNSIA